MSEQVQGAYHKLVTLSGDEILRHRALSRDIARLDELQRMEDAIEEAVEEAAIIEAISAYQDILQAFYKLDFTPYLKKLREQPLDTIHALRKSLPKDKSLILQDLENL
ncbi:hypothetical protein [Tumebacillus flagellatus]|uniref:Uncharacterized protein n=1 Tax=Tumebacillus flagellatus TaxID=1157490 RepID=A0A074LNN6_9BACL|nr:hypothetical protein [Tumebacillus flagellatus]KEO82704.1 hypothetical protein EL26_14150 [Tumebacillus flagellatus]